jgi:hypothetical protein
MEEEGPATSEGSTKRRRLRKNNNKQSVVQNKPSEAEEKTAELTGVVSEVRSEESGKEEEVVPLVPVPLPLPHELCLEVAQHLHESEALAFALSCTGFRDAMKETLRTRKRSSSCETAEGKWLTTNAKHYTKVDAPPVTKDWIKWAFSMKWEYRLGENATEVEAYRSELKRKKFEENPYHDFEESDVAVYFDGGIERQLARKKVNMLYYLIGRGGFKDLLVSLKDKDCSMLCPSEFGFTYEFRESACCGALEGGHIKVLKYARNNEREIRSDCLCAYLFNQYKYSNYSRYIARGGHVKVLKYLKSTAGWILDKRTCYCCALQGQLKALKYFRREVPTVRFDSHTCQLAAKHGHLDVLKYLKSEGVPFGNKICWAAAEGGNIEVLKYLKSEGLSFTGSNYNMLLLAALGGHIQALKYLESEGLSFLRAENGCMCDLGAEGGHIDVLQYLKSEGVPFETRNCHFAAAKGHLDVLKYMKSEGVSFDSETCEYAARGGHIKVLKYLKSEGMSLKGFKISKSAAEGGHFGTLIYLDSVGVSFGKETCKGAARGCHLKVLQWLLLEKRCPWNKETCLKHLGRANTNHGEGDAYRMEQWMKNLIHWESL